MFIPILCGQWDSVMDLDILIMDGDMEDMAVTGAIRDTDGAIQDIGELDGDIQATGELDTTTITPIIMEEEDLLLITEEETMLLTVIIITPIEEAIVQIEITPLTEALQLIEIIPPIEVTPQTDKTVFLITEEVLL